jgi:hypothetical protein
MSEATLTRVTSSRRHPHGSLSMWILRLIVTLRRWLLPGRELAIRNHALMRKLSKDSTHADF